MIVVMEGGASPAAVDAVEARIQDLGFRAHRSQGEERTIIGVIGDDRRREYRDEFGAMEAVERVILILHPFKLASREWAGRDTVVRVGEIAIGAGQPVAVMAGPCAVESWDQLLATAKAVRARGARILRGGAFKPRTSPYSFQGLGEEGLRLLARARDETGLAVVTEVLAPEEVPLVARYADILQVGARNMQNFRLLEAVGAAAKPVLLKRGMMSSLEELLMSAEYILNGGNPDVILCERGIRTFETYSRNTLDLTAVPLVKKLSHLPIVVDPSHATGHWDLVIPMARAGVAAGADGLIVEVHPDPAKALSDGPESLKFSTFDALMSEVGMVARAVGREL